MTEAGLFVAGGAVTLVVFVGLLIYGMLSFAQWSALDKAPKTATTSGSLRDSINGPDATVDSGSDTGLDA